MTETTATCAVGCTTRGQHTTDCADRSECRGCLPRPAEHGTLCAWCWQRLNADVAGAPRLVAHLREIGKPAAQAAPPSDTQTHRDPAEGSILPAAWVAADELHAMLASWALLILEEHPSGARMAGPDEVGAWHTAYGATVGVRTPAATARLCAWLTPLLPWCAEQEWAAEMRREVGEAVATMSARWPTPDMVEPPHAVPMPCPACGWRSLVYAPPSVAGAAFRVSCSNPDCARVWSEDEWEWFVTMMTKGERMRA